MFNDECKGFHSAIMRGIYDFAINLLNYPTTRELEGLKPSHNMVI